MNQVSTDFDINLTSDIPPLACISNTVIMEKYVSISMSKSLVKLIDASLVPAALLIIGKIIGILITNTVFKLDWSLVTDPNDFFSVRIVYNSLQDQLTATSYSNLIMYLVMLAGFSFILIRTLLFSVSHISPRLIAKLATNNLLNLIKDSFEIYYHASVWLILLWISLFALMINVLIGKAFVWTGAITLMVTIFVSAILLRDVTNEIELTRKKLVTEKA